MRLLLDTHTFLWWIVNNAQLSTRSKALIEDGDNVIMVSAVTAWEIAIKAQLGKIRLPNKPSLFFGEQLVQRGFQPLSVTASHALHTFELPPLHNDPFDRLLVAQSDLERLPIISRDPLIKQYSIKTLW